LITTTALHTFKIQSSATNVLYVTEQSQLLDLNKHTTPFVILGQGSNSIFTEDFSGLVIVNRLKGIEVSESGSDFVLKVKSGENWHELVKYCLANNIYGLENLALIPGTVGAAPIQNIGAYGVEVKQFISAVHYFDLIERVEKVLTNEECLFGYRDSIFKHELKGNTFITQVDFSLPKSWSASKSYAPLDELNDPTAQQIYDLVCQTRKTKLPDPVLLGNSGSFFKNPVISVEHKTQLKQEFPDMPCYPVDEHQTKVAAGWLIDQAGLKGFEYKNVAVHHAQALVLVNKTGNATGPELLDLINIVRARVEQMFGITLELEVRLIGKNGEITV